jgi:phage terminase small subunit
MPIVNGFSFKEKLFCENYINNGYNGAKAARDAGYSEKTADAIGRENLHKPRIRQYLDKRMKEVMDKVGVGIEWRLQLMKRGAEGAVEGKTNKDGLLDVDSMMKPIQELNRMDGSYAPEKITNTHLVAEITDKISTTFEECEKQLKEF